MTSCLSDQQVHQFKTDGFIVLRDFYRSDDILAIQLGIYDVIGHVMKKNGVRDRRAAFSSGSFGQGYSELIRQNRSWGGEVYDGVKQIPAFIRLVADPAHQAIFTELRPGAQPGIAGGGFGIRIDNPNEDQYRAMWHQEYPAQLRSKDGLVYWSPLVPVTEDLGPVIFCPGSHLEGPLPVSEADPDRVGRAGAYALRIHNEHKYIEKYEQKAPLTKPRDLIIADFLTIHSSGYNRAVCPRWSMQFRYFNFSEPTGRSYAWRGSFAAGVDFREIHPELFIK